MSHKATTWLASLPADALSHAEFRVLFHLCDCHNASGGCFPAQGYLMQETSLSNGGLNNALNSLEERGLIKRDRGCDPHTRRRRPTRYVLGFEVDEAVVAVAAAAPAPARDPSPMRGVGKRGKPSPTSGVGSISTLTPVPSPLSGDFHLHTGGDKPVSKPVRNLGRAGAARSDAANSTLTADQKKDQTMRLWADRLAKGEWVSQASITVGMAQRMLTQGLVSEAQLRKAGVAY